MKKLLLTVIMASSLLTANTAFAEGQGKHYGGFGKQGNYQKIYRQLDLSNEQKKQIKTILKKAQPINKAAMLKERQAHMKSRMELIQSDSLDHAALAKLAEKQAEGIKKRYIKMAEAQHAAWKVLTPAQQKEAKAIQEKRMDKMQKRSEKRLRKQEKRRDKKGN